jgi:hypothetical protein
VEAEEIYFQNLLDRVAAPFRHEAENRGLSFDVHTDPSVGRSIITDSKRLQQVLKNLLSNAFKFTESGGVRLDLHAAAEGWNSGHPVLSQAPLVVAFTVSDTGIGIPLDKQRIIFEAFQQAAKSSCARFRAKARPSRFICRSRMSAPARPRVPPPRRNSCSSLRRAARRLSNAFPMTATTSSPATACC